MLHSSPPGVCRCPEPRPCPREDANGYREANEDGKRVVHEDSEFYADPRLHGCKSAVRRDGHRYAVSPAFYSLLQRAGTKAERDALLATLKVLDTRLCVADLFSVARVRRWRHAVAEVSRWLSPPRASSST